MDHVKFTQMKDRDKDDYDFVTAHETEYNADNRIMPCWPLNWRPV